MKTKGLFGTLLITFLTVMGLMACSDNEKDATGVAGTEWYGSHVVTTITNEGAEETHTASLGLLFSEDGTSCTVETGIEGLLAANRVTKCVIYYPDTHTILLTDSPESSRTEYQGVIEGECMQVQCLASDHLPNEIIHLFKKK